MIRRKRASIPIRNTVKVDASRISTLLNGRQKWVVAEGQGHFLEN